MFAHRAGAGVRLTAWITCLLLAPLHQSTAADAPPSDRWALLVGVNQYTNMRALEYAVADVRSLRDQLKQAGFSAQKIVLIEDEARDANLRPTKKNIERAIDQIVAKLKPGGTIVVGLCGHGVGLDDKSYFCPADAPAFKTGENPQTEKFVALEPLYQKLEKCPASFKLVLVDACRNDPRGLKRRGLDIPPETDRLNQALQRAPNGIAVLRSCDQGQFSHEDPKLGHGVFMHFVLEGMSGKATPEGRETVTYGDLVGYAGDMTQSHVRHLGDSQRPMMSGNVAASAMKFPLFELTIPQNRGPRPGATAVPPSFQFANGPKSATEARAAQAGWAKQLRTEVTLRDPSGIKLVLIPPGEFRMGSPEGEAEGQPDETSHAVSLTRPFYLGIHEITQSQYQRMMGKNPSYFSSHGENPRGRLELDTSDFPVEGVSWEEAEAFCKKLSNQYSKHYRLPTEAEWEYACRAGTTSEYHLGDSLGSNQANFNGEFPYGTAAVGPSLGRPAPVGSYAPNNFGLYDMHGNVREWCGDNYDRDFYTTGPRTDPTGPQDGDGRVLRGGAWKNAASDLRSAARHKGEASSHTYLSGFRIVREP